MENKIKLITFLDAVGRTILGVHNESLSNETDLAVNNPVVLHVVPQDQSGRMSVQLLPIFFREFLADKSSDVTYIYKNASITKTNIEALDFRLKSQYDQLFNKSNLFVPPTTQPENQQSGSSQAIVNLFDE
ncbi:hypothetical protein EBU91_00860 [bacterium]|nr:hypothetical protein [bacterium]